MADTQRKVVRSIEWSNWAGTESTTLARVATPRSEEELIEEIRKARRRGLRVKAIGAGHSFTGVAVTDGLQLRLGGLTGVTTIDATRGEATVRAGTPLHVLNEELAQLGLALPNLGDIDKQSLAGAIATGTHGTGLRFTGLAGGVRSLRIVLADGSVVDCSPTRAPDLFQAARLGLGALGVITEVTVEVVPAFLLHADERPEPLAAVLDSLDDEIESHDHFEFYWYPHTERTQVKRNKRVGPGTEADPLPRWRQSLDDEVLTNRVWEAACRFATRVPRATKPLMHVAARAQTARTYTDASYKVFATPREVRFRESEWAVPRAALKDVLLAVKAGSTATTRRSRTRSSAASRHRTTCGCRRPTSARQPGRRGAPLPPPGRGGLLRRRRADCGQPREGAPTGASCTRGTPTTSTRSTRASRLPRRAARLGLKRSVLPRHRRP